MGILLKRIALKNNPFYIVQVKAPCFTQIRDPKNPKKLLRRTVKIGDTIGLSDSATVHMLAEHLGKDIRVQFTGTTPSKAYPGKHVKLFKVEVDDEQPSSETDTHIS
jgi:hypothetical protein